MRAERQASLNGCRLTAARQAGTCGNNAYLEPSYALLSQSARLGRRFLVDVPRLHGEQGGSGNPQATPARSAGEAADRSQGTEACQHPRAWATEAGTVGSPLAGTGSVLRSCCRRKSRERAGQPL